MKRGGRRAKRLMPHRGIAVISLLIALTALVACGDRGESQNLAVASAEEEFNYSRGELRKMVRQAGVVILGHVEAVQSGRVVGEGEAALTFREVTLRVEEVLRGSFSGDQLVFEETGWDGAKPIVLNGYYPSAEGDRGIYFLLPHANPPPAYAILTHAQGRFLFEGGQTVGPDDSDPFVRSLEDLSPEELREAVKNA